MKIPEYNVGDVVRIKRDLWNCISICGVTPRMAKLAGEVTVITNKVWFDGQFVYGVTADEGLCAWDYPLFENKYATLG